MRRRPRLVGLLWRWHRRLGVLAALFALVLAVTGIVLNHSPELGLDRRFVDWPWLSRVYGDGSAELTAYPVGSHWLSRTANGLVYFDDVEVAPCAGQLVGATRLGEMYVAACTRQLLLVTASGELVEAADAGTGLPGPLVAVGRVDEGLVVQAAGDWWLADLDRMDFSRAAPAGALVRQLAPGELPRDLLSRIPAAQAWLSWERLLLDLHSGRLLGRPGVLVVDAVGLLLGVLALSGLGMWFLHRRSRRVRN